MTDTADEWPVCPSVPWDLPTRRVSGYVRFSRRVSYIDAHSAGVPAGNMSPTDIREFVDALVDSLFHGITQ